LSKVLVAGGAGFIGSNLTKYLLEKGHEVVVFDNLDWGNEKAVDPRATLVVGDLLSTPDIDRAFEEGPFDGVFALAGLISVPESVSAPEQYWAVNFQGMMNLLNVIKEKRVPKIVFSSTAAVYAPGNEMPLVESSLTGPLSPYGQTKLAFEFALAGYAKAYGIGAVALRYFNASGAWPDGSLGEAHKVEGHLIPNTLKVALGQSDKVTIFGNDFPTPDGTCVRDYIHVCDLASAHLAAMEWLSPGQFEAFNLATGQGFSNRQIVEACKAETGVDIPVQFGPRREGDAPSLYADPRKALDLLGWKAQYGLEEIIRHAWDFHRTHPNGYN
jgi:UDP-glucose 4-epimerase